MFPKAYRGALSLTFDDGFAVSARYAVPALNKAHIPGTFFLIPNTPFEDGLPISAWRTVLEQGHEIGSHTMNHRKAAELSEREMLSEALDSRKWLEQKFGRRIPSFCYPYTDAPRNYQKAVSQAGYLQARGGRSARFDKYILETERPNLLNTPCYHVSDATFEHGVLFALIDAALERRAWLTLMFHGVGPDVTQWDNVGLENFDSLMKFLHSRKERGLWVGTYGEVAKIFQ